MTDPGEDAARFAGDARVDPAASTWWRPSGSPSGGAAVEFAIIPGGLAFRHSEDREVVVRAGWPAVRSLLADLLSIHPDLISKWSGHPFSSGIAPD